MRAGSLMQNAQVSNEHRHSGMGKLGAIELNCSSDIDLIVLYDDKKGGNLKNVNREVSAIFKLKLAMDLAGRFTSP